VNPHGITGGNRAWEAAIDHSRILKWTEAFWTEESIDPGYTADGRLLSHIRSYKLARSYRNILMTYIANNPVAMAESLAFNQTIGFAGVDPLTPDVVRYIDFYKKHREFFTGAEDAATVAVLRSYPSLTYNQADVQLATILTEQALIEAKVPFDLIFDEQLSNLSRYKVLVLPDTECLSDGQLASIRKFVADGGGLVATGQAGLYDQWRRLRVEPGLKGLIASQPKARDYEEEAATAEIAGTAMRKEFGKGRAAYIPRVDFDGPLPEFGNYFYIDTRFWKRPKNAEQLTQAVRWVARDDVPVQIGGPAWVIANLAAQPDKRRMVLHLVNYRKAAPLEPVPVLSRLPQGRKAKDVTLYSPDSAGPVRIGMKAAGSEVRFDVPLKTYTMAVIQW
jgi:hypothetical protein